MSLPNANNLSTLDWAYQGVPFNKVESKAGQNTNSLDWTYQGVPFVAAVQSTLSSYNKTQFFMVF